MLSTGAGAVDLSADTLGPSALSPRPQLLCLPSGLLPHPHPQLTLVAVLYHECPTCWVLLLLARNLKYSRFLLISVLHLSEVLKSWSRVRTAALSSTGDHPFSDSSFVENLNCGPHCDQARQLVSATLAGAGLTWRWARARSPPV